MVLSFRMKFEPRAGMISRFCWSVPFWKVFGARLAKFRARSVSSSQSAARFSVSVNLSFWEASSLWSFELRNPFFTHKTQSTIFEKMV